MVKTICALVIFLCSTLASAQDIPAIVIFNNEKTEILVDFDQLLSKGICIDKTTNRVIDRTRIHAIDIFGSRYTLEENENGQINLFEVVVDGSISLLKNRTLGRDTLYLQKGNILKALKTENKLIQNERVIIPHYQGLLKNFLNDCESIEEAQYENINLREKNILNLIVSYNEVCGYLNGIYEPFKYTPINLNTQIDFDDATILLKSAKKIIAPINRNDLIRNAKITSYHFEVPSDQVEKVTQLNKTYYIKKAGDEHIACKEEIRGNITIYSAYGSTPDGTRLFAEKGDLFKELSEGSKESTFRQLLMNTKECSGF